MPANSRWDLIQDLKGLRKLRHDEKSNASLITDATTAKVVFTALICTCIKDYTDNKKERLKIGCIT